jgi:hypothetical protein
MDKLVLLSVLSLQLAVAISFPKNWQQTNPLVTAKPIQTVTYGNDLWLFWAGGGKNIRSNIIRNFNHMKLEIQLDVAQEIMK